MTFHQKGFRTYSKDYKLDRKECACGGSFTLVNLEKSTGDRLEVNCSDCKITTFANKKRPSIKPANRVYLAG